jgi:hypothetical protein
MTKLWRYECGILSANAIYTIPHSVQLISWKTLYDMLTAEITKLLYSYSTNLMPWVTFMFLSVFCWFLLFLITPIQFIHYNLFSYIPFFYYEQLQQMFTLLLYGIRTLLFRPIFVYLQVNKLVFRSNESVVSWVILVNNIFLPEGGRTTATCSSIRSKINLR